LISGVGSLVIQCVFIAVVGERRRADGCVLGRWMRGGRCGDRRGGGWRCVGGVVAG